jgi:membrane protein required for beta-lactamase induction
VSPPSEESSVPPYPAELPASAPAAAATKPGLAAAAYRALPKPKPKAKVRSKTKAKTTKARAKARTGEGRHANLVIARLEPWSVMKFSFLISLVAWVILFVAVTLLYYALSGLGVFAAIQRTLESVTSSQQSPGVSLAAWTSASRVLGYTMLIGAVDIILITALSTIGAVIYNLVTHLGGGIEITLKETD